MPWSLIRSSCSRISPGRLRILLLLLSAGLVWGSVRGFLFLVREWRLQQVIRRCRAAAIAEKARLRQRLAEHEDDTIAGRALITEMPVSSLVTELQEGRMSPSEVLAAYQACALLADDACNCVASVLTSAEKSVRILEKMRPEERREKPLFGVPVSVKEHLAVNGEECTFGNPSYIGRGSGSDAAVVRVIKMAGAVPFVRTNMSQMGFAIDCANPLYGETLNPRDHARSPGGSSGGDASLVSMGGTPIGIGSDVGGSIRIPAALCGCCGFKPTAERVSSLDCPPVQHAQSYVVPLSIGPLGKDVEAITIASRVLFSSAMHERDPYVPPISPSPSISALTIGYYVSLKGEDVIRAVPAAQRAVMEAKEALERRGHKLLPWSPPHTDWLQLCLAPYFTDAGQGLQMACHDEKVTRDLALCSVLFSLPSLARAALVLLIRPFSLLLSRQLNATRGCGSVYRLWRFMENIGTYNSRFTAQWQKQGLDAVICPPLPFAAPPLGHSGLLSGAVIYCSLYNVLNLPAGVLPVTSVSEQDVVRLEKEYPNDDLLLKLLKRGQRGTEGLPVGVQCVTMKWKDELCLHVMNEVEKGMEM